MKKMKNPLLMVLLLTFLMITLSCKKSDPGISSLYTPTSADVTATATLDQLLQGRALYIANCNACHQLYSPDDYTAVQWKSIMGNMAPRTGMSASDVLLVSKYVSKGQ